jgi:Periplasmic copper-binding protein (NosD)
VTGLLGALACALIGLGALPGLAAAGNFDVNTARDEPNIGVGAVCDTGAPAAEDCSLRAAIEAADADPGTAVDEINFEPSIFLGRVGVDEIEPTSALPPIEHPLAIEGELCTTSPPARPCVGLAAPSGEPGLIVDSPEVTVTGLAIGGGSDGIEVTDAATGFVAKGNWMGLKLDGTANPIQRAGIFLEPGSEGARIGEGEEARNVFVHSEVGVFIDGSSHDKIQGDYIGVGPSGEGAASVEVGVRIVDAEGPTAAKAEDNEVGGTLTAPQASTPTCDGPCNVIATDNRGLGVDLTGVSGEGVEAASGPTRIRGNYIGLASDGIDPVGVNGYGVFAAPTESGCEGGPADVTVGGSAPTETNYIDGASTGLFAEGAENFRASGNAIGIAADGSARESPGIAISLCAYGVTERAHISANEMILEPTAIGIDSEYGAADITGNAIHGGQIGVFALGESEGRGDLIQGNSVSSPDTVGIRILNQSNTVIGNSIDNAGDWGIELEGDADHNRIGGDSPGEANDIDRSQNGGAIVIDGIESTRNEVAANTGFGNSGAFLQLIGQSTEEALNGGIKPPPLTTVQQSSATGTAEPAATVRIFRKASAEGGELGALLAVVTAGAGGNWKATYATLPVGSLVAATQTSEAGTPEGATSEVSLAVAATADPVEPIEPGGGGSGGGSNGGGPSTVTTESPVPPTPSKPKAPKVTITKGPKKSSKSTTAKFTFKATPAAGAKFQCKLDNARWATCKSPKTYKDLKPRKHTFRVRAIASGLTSPAAKFKFTVGR